MIIGGVIAVGVVLFALLLVHQLLDNDKHFIFQLLLLTFVMIGALLVLPKMVIDDYTICDTVVNQSVVTGNTTAYSYMLECNPHPSSTDVTFYKISTTMFWLFIGYLVVFLAFWSFYRLKDSVSGGKLG